MPDKTSVPDRIPQPSSSGGEGPASRVNPLSADSGGHGAVVPPAPALVVLPRPCPVLAFGPSGGTAEDSARFAALHTGAAHVVLELHPDGTCRGCGAADAGRLPDLPGRLVGRRLAEWMPAAAARLLEDAVRRAAAGDCVVRVEHPFPTAAGLRTFETRVVAAGGPGTVLATGRDVTEEQQAGRQLRTIRAAADFVEEALAITDPAGVVLFANRAMRRRFGIRVGEAGGTGAAPAPTLESLFADPSVATAVVAETGAGRTWRAETHAPTAEGHVVPVVARASSFRDETGAGAGHLVVLMDRSELIAASMALEESERRRREVIEAVDDGVFDWDVRTGEAWMSPRLWTMLGWEPGGRPHEFETWRRHVHPEDLPRVLACIDDHLAGRTDLYACDYRMLCRDGSWKWIFARGRCRFDADGRPQRMIGTHQDNTLRRRMEDDLRRIRLAVDAVGDAVVLTDLQGLAFYANPAFHTLYGWRAEDLADGPPVWSRIFPDEADRERVPARVRAVGLWEGELPVTDRRGRTFAARVHVRLIRDENDQPVGFVSVHEDTTERRRTEEQLRAAKTAAEQASEAKSRFLATMGHEIRTPLAEMTGYAELLAEQAGLPARSREWLGIIRRSGAHLATLLDDLLDLGRIEAGRVRIDPSPQRMGALLSALPATYRARASAKRLRLSVRVDGRVPERFLADGVRLRQVLDNLLSNAVRFTDRGGVELRVSAARRATGLPGEAGDSAGPEPADLCFRVIDTGIGIAAEDVPGVFEPFRQARTPDGAGRGGVGLGLAIVHQLTRLMGGSVSVHSIVGEGSEFTVRLPVEGAEGWTDRPDTAPEPAGVPEAELRDTLQGAVLLAEDSPELRMLVRRRLEQWGLTVTAAADGTEALRLAGQERFALLLLDWRMPGLEGPEVARRLRRAGVGVPIIALTAHALPAEQAVAQAAGCDAHLPKPIDFPRLYRLVRGLAPGLVAARPERSREPAWKPPASGHSAEDDVHIDRGGVECGPDEVADGCLDGQSVGFREPSTPDGQWSRVGSDVGSVGRGGGRDRPGVQDRSATDGSRGATDGSPDNRVPSGSESTGAGLTAVTVAGAAAEPEAPGTRSAGGRRGVRAGRNAAPATAGADRPADESPGGSSGSMSVDVQMQELLREYAGQLPRLVGELESLATGARWRDLSLAAHRLRGTAATFGYLAVADAAGEVEGEASRRELAVAGGHRGSESAATGDAGGPGRRAGARGLSASLAELRRHAADAALRPAGTVPTDRVDGSRGR